MSLAFKPDLKWRFWRKDGATITATISDESFLEHMKSGEEMFADGDILKVSLEYERRFNETAQMWEDVGTSYEIPKVHDHLSPLENMTLF
jgi:hypothetical protein